MKPAVILPMALFLLLSAHDAEANEDTYQKAIEFLDALCVSSSLGERRFKENSEYFTAQQMTEEQLYKLNPVWEMGYIIHSDAGIFFATYGKKDFGGQEIRNCSISFDGGNHEIAKRYIENSFDLENVDNVKQGVSNVSTYIGYLYGFQSSVMLAIQSGFDVTSFILGDFPRK